MATGLTDGAIVRPEAIMSYRINETAPYLIDVRSGAVSSVALSANQRTWERLLQEDCLTANEGLFLTVTV